MDIQTDKMIAKISHSYTSYTATMTGGPTPTHSLTTVESKHKPLKVKPNRLDRPPVTGPSIGHKPRLPMLFKGT